MIRATLLQAEERDIALESRRLYKNLSLKLLVFAQAVETPVINSSSFQNNPHPDDYTIRTKVDNLQCAFEDF